ncbi:MAG: hypothetical protein V1809_08805, partial [Planctomycetota bacterium]
MLIVALGALTALSLIAVAFATTMRLESMATLNYTRTVQEELMARAAFEYALSLVKGDTNNTDSKTDAWHYENAAFVFKGAPTDTNLTMPPRRPAYVSPAPFDGMTTAYKKTPDVGAFMALVLDTQSKLYINDWRDLNPCWQTGNPLKWEDKSWGLAYVTKELTTTGDYLSPQFMVLDLIGSGAVREKTAPSDLMNASAQYHRFLKHVLTPWAYENAVTKRAPVNVNTASDQVLKQVLNEVPGMAPSLDAVVAKIIELR